jgi:carboxypeptidase Taq
MEDKLNQLKQYLTRSIDLNYAAAVLSWDQETHMPPGGAKSRADQFATLQSLAQQFFTDPQVCTLLDDLRPMPRTCPSIQMKQA